MPKFAIDKTFFDCNGLDVVCKSVEEVVHVSKILDCMGLQPLHKGQGGFIVAIFGYRLYGYFVPNSIKTDNRVIQYTSFCQLINGDKVVKAKYKVTPNYSWIIGDAKV